MVDGADLEAVLVAPDEARVSPPVSGRASRHAARLGEDARPAVVAARERDRVLVVVRQMEVAVEPALDLRAFAHNIDELLRGRAGPAVVVQPAAAVHHVVLLQDADATANNRRVGKAKNGPALLGRLRGHELLEPLDLLGVDEDLVGRVGRVAEFGGPKTD